MQAKTVIVLDNYKSNSIMMVRSRKLGKKNIVWNDYISNNERFADFINGVVFHGEQLVRPEALTALDTKLWRKERKKDSYHEFIRDMVKIWDYQGRKYLFGLEPEESPHLALPVKYMNYESLEYDRQYKEIVRRHRNQRDLPADQYISGVAGTDRLMPVVTIGIYLGEKTWHGSARMGDLTAMAEIPPQIRRQIESFWNDFQVNLLDIHSLESVDVFRTDLREVFGFLKLQGNKAELIRYVEENEAFRSMSEDAFDVLSIYADNVKLELHKEAYRVKEGLDMCTALRELEEDARREGRKEGLATGVKKGSYLMNELNRRLVQDGRTEDLFRSIQDDKYQRRLMEEYGICDL